MNETIDKTVYNENNIAEKYLVFYLEDQLFALPGEQIIEILNMQPITFIPNLPLYIKGIVNIRGKIIPLIDLKLRLDKSEIEYDDKTCIILIQVEEITAGLIVDRVKEVTDISADDLRPVSSFSNDGSFNRFVTDICQINENMILLLNAKNILRDDGM